MSGNASQAVWEIVSRLPSPKREQRLVMALQAYIDDSGGVEKNQHHFFVLAGLVATAERWADFSTDWQSVLDIEPRFEYFKMSEAKALRKQFSIRHGWNRELRDERVAQLVEVIRSYAIFRVSVSIDKTAFYKHVAGIKLKNPAETHGDPYFLAFHKLVLGLPLRQATNLETIPDDAKIDFVFDQQGITGTRASAAWDRLKNNILPKLKMREIPNISPFFGSPPIYRDEKQFLPLQAADLYVWHLRKHRARNRLLVVPPDRTLARIMEIPGEDTLYDQSAILDLRYDVLESLALYGAGSTSGPVLP